MVKIAWCCFPGHQCQSSQLLYRATQLGQLTGLLESSMLDISQCPSLSATLLRQRNVAWGKMTRTTLLMTHRFEIRVFVYSSLRWWLRMTFFFENYQSVGVFAKKWCWKTPPTCWLYHVCCVGYFTVCLFSISQVEAYQQWCAHTATPKQVAK